jgi:hypothetical protein
MKKENEKLIKYIIIVVGLVASLMLFLPALAAPESDSSFLGYEIAFGTEFANLGSFASGEIVWSIFGILAYATPLLASLVILYLKKTTILSAALFAIGTVLLFTMHLYTTTTITILNSVTEIEINWVIAYGLFIAIALSAFGFLLSLYLVVSKK